MVVSILGILLGGRHADFLQRFLVSLVDVRRQWVESCSSSRQHLFISGDVYGRVIPDTVRLLFMGGPLMVILARM